MRVASSTPLLVSLCCWAALELGLVVRDLVRGRARLNRDRGTRGVVAVSLGGAIFVAGLLRGSVPALDTPTRGVFVAAGIVVFWAGLIVRVWAIVTLGRSFSTFVRVETDQTVVTSGPYRWVRHPSYTGLLLIAAGFGLGAGNWLSIAICFTVPLLGLLPRIVVEEAEMVRTLGERYTGYQRTTRRLVPGIW
jgi:protein-S-isoprenylcysteine O-methyltransferase Ste14